VTSLIGCQDETRNKITHRERELIEVMLTNTHVFGFFFFPYWHRRRKQDVTIIQAFTVPDDQPLANNRNGILCLSHEGLLFQEAPGAVI
jgi:hypothetical protein